MGETAVLYRMKNGIVTSVNLNKRIAADYPDAKYVYINYDPDGSYDGSVGIFYITLGYADGSNVSRIGVIKDRDILVIDEE